MWLYLQILQWLPRWLVIQMVTSLVLLLGEAHAALLAVQTIASCSAYSLILEGDALNVVLAIQQPQ
jgi:hypothetical protein